MSKDSIVAFFIGIAIVVNTARGESTSSRRADCVVVYRSNWASGVDFRLRIEAATSKSITATYSKEYNGIVLKAWMKRDDDFRSVVNGVPRAEVSFSPVARLINGHDYWIVWSTMMSADYQIDTLQPEIISQIHQSSREIGSPPFSLMIAGATYQADVRGGRGTPSNSFKFGNPADDKGRIIRWMLHYRPDHGGEAAVVELYKNNVNVVHSIGFPDAYEGERNGYFKVGIYKWWWVTRPSEVAVRELLFGDLEITECINAESSH